jgi:hypothetical protein
MPAPAGAGMRVALLGGLSFLAPQDLATARHQPQLLLTGLTQHHAEPDTIRTVFVNTCA